MLHKVRLFHKHEPSQLAFEPEGLNHLVQLRRRNFLQEQSLAEYKRVYQKEQGKHMVQIRRLPKTTTEKFRNKRNHLLTILKSPVPIQANKYESFRLFRLQGIYTFRLCFCFQARPVQSEQFRKHGLANDLLLQEFLRKKPKLHNL